MLVRMEHKLKRNSFMIMTIAIIKDLYLPEYFRPRLAFQFS